MEEGGVNLERAVVAPGPDGAFLDLEIAAGFEMLIDLSDECWPVCDTSRWISVWDAGHDDLENDIPC